MRVLAKAARVAALFKQEPLTFWRIANNDQSLSSPVTFLHRFGTSRHVTSPLPELKAPADFREDSVSRQLPADIATRPSAGSSLVAVEQQDGLQRPLTPLKHRFWQAWEATRTPKLLWVDYHRQPFKERMVAVSSKRRAYDRARRLMASAEPLDLLVVRTMIGLFVTFGDTQAVTQCMHQAQAQGLPLQASWFEALLGKTFWTEMRALQKPSLKSYRHAMSAWVQSLRVEQVEELFKEASADYPARTLEPQWHLGQFARARAVFEEAKAAGVPPNELMYSTLVDAYGKAGQLQAANAVLDEMSAAGVSPTAYTYTTLMRWQGEAGNAEEVLKLLDTVQAAQGHLTPVVRYLAAEAVMGCWRRQGRDPALLAEAESIIGKDNPLPGVIEACCDAHKKGVRRGLKVDLHAFGRSSSQLSVLLVLQRLLDLYSARPSDIPYQDLQIITGKAARSQYWHRLEDCKPNFLCTLVSQVHERARAIKVQQAKVMQQCQHRRQEAGVQK
ncbi:hypothetical protein WJX73_008347 [Symbiochloris irregularis]|uniref:Pentacotripeptide-repeat region of PRORP domain-containing protein n=1 Tax=Symbiochloris irregularis TaxID=706552 RepID=A0AAW1PE48_9CHLO